VGDTFKFGESSRMYLLGGPEELMPAADLTPSQKRQLAALEAAKKAKQVRGWLGSWMGGVWCIGRCGAGHRVLAALQAAKGAGGAGALVAGGWWVGAR
jgi:hypothetical protein